MDQKRELSSIDLAALVTELNRYEGAKVDKAYLYDDDLLRLKLRDFDRGRVELMIEVGDIKRAHAADPDHVADAPGRPPNFAKMLRNRLSGADFAGVEQYEFDRILTFEFEREDQNTTLVAELFGQGNVAALDETGEVIGALSTVRLKSRTVAPGSQYEYPASRLNPLDASRGGFDRHMRESDSDVVRTLATQLNLGGLYAEEVCTRAGVPKETPIEEATDDQLGALHDALSRIDERLRSGDIDPRVYEESIDGDGSDGGADDADPRVVDVTPFPLAEHEDLPSVGFDSFNAAVDEYFHRLGSEETGDGEAPADASASRPDFEEEIAKQERIIEQQRGAIEGFEEQAQAERERAELLYANYDLVDEVISTVREARENEVPWDEIAETLGAGAERGIPAAEAVVDVDGGEGTVTVELEDDDGDPVRVEVDASEGVEVNADRLYREAKRVEEKKEGAMAAIESTREELEAVKERKAEWEEQQAADDGGEEEGDDEDDDEAYETDWLSRSSIPIRSPDDWFERFRWFRTSTGYLVIGGRNADQNEELVKKYMGKHDRFFHTQAHGGPVTILKASGPSESADPVDFSEETLREAAQFAVSYSSDWKDGRGAGDAYMVDPDQVSKTPESGEYIEKGSFVIRGDRTYFEDVPCRIAVGVQCEPVTRAIGGPPSAVVDRAAAHLTFEPGMYAQNDAAMMAYRNLKERFADQSFVRKVASADQLQEFLPPGGSDIVD
ncbi:ribosome rescue protein RqcH [Halorubrum ezzemoulense]|uniref:ribosome rescue protein RqcH n=1 Tax=Halorubrum ezzemoulense TaxID=337243 RepID=UPI00232BA3A2|nr:ribosome rescue protein RqcH [Halorubrum ezzemoulense]MDB2237393.1 ribosome rescue protein RqcH [Halorubrum ezzemoulense]MDB2246657.1 ribosome rescue protein RqcH [Halorubrum ezzemoulense]MDB9250519.1 ribosome rescue protein RqcH [Halorubrum ezzemoulense]MDB9260623.1 ribosome rescue protein RqcH [Halorubrum ezzemoulense]MDB9264023.1 ribosome rescue protein RqcH [Halorubrum ezzemoulense]